MSKRRLVALIIRYLVQDHEKHAKAAGMLFDACDRGDVVIVVLPTTRPPETRTKIFDHLTTEICPRRENERPMDGRNHN